LNASTGCEALFHGLFVALSSLRSTNECCGHSLRATGELTGWRTTDAAANALEVWFDVVQALVAGEETFQFVLNAINALNNPLSDGFLTVNHQVVREFGQIDHRIWHRQNFAFFSVTT
jgi:hypothetical protein